MRGGFTLPLTLCAPSLVTGEPTLDLEQGLAPSIGLSIALSLTPVTPVTPVTPAPTRPRTPIPTPASALELWCECNRVSAVV